jgi:hypothetical protein
MNTTSFTSDVNSTTTTQFLDPSFDLGCQIAAKRILQYMFYPNSNIMKEEIVTSELIKIMKEEIVGNVNFNQS